MRTNGSCHSPSDNGVSQSSSCRPDGRTTFEVDDATGGVVRYIRDFLILANRPGSCWPITKPQRGDRIEKRGCKDFVYEV